MSKKAFGFYTAVSIVIANMIGTGVFTSLGFQVIGIHSTFAILLLWVIGGVIALSGALSYGELAAAMPRSGGEYVYLSRIYHPAVGFLSGWTSATVGFAAPIALAAMALGNYLNKVNSSISPLYAASLVVLFFTFLHSTDLKLGGKIQNIFTIIKVSLIMLFIFLGFSIDVPEAVSILPQTSANDPSASWNIIFSPVFAVSLIYVSYAYSGWNASSYIAGEIENPQKNLPRSLFRGTLVVMVLYILLNYIFLYTVPMNELAGQLEIGFISAEKIFGLTGGKIMATVIALLLVSSVSSMILTGPRVMQTMGEDIKGLNFLSLKNKKGIPVYAVICQSAITMILIFTGSFEKVLTFVGFTLNLFTFLTVLGVIVLRYREPLLPRPYKTWAYPVTPLFFLGLSGFTLYFLITERPVESLAGFGIILIGLVIYFFSKKTLTPQVINYNNSINEELKVQQ